MTITFDCTDEMIRLCPAAVHVDGTARPQLVSERTNPSFHKIVRRYYERTGIPAIINTSFNMHEEPIVCTPADAIRAFLLGNLDYLAIGSFLVPHPGLRSSARTLAATPSSWPREQTLIRRSTRMQRTKSPIILIEFNELTPWLMAQFMAAGHLPNFQRFYDESHIYTTDAEEEGENLNPWVQWVTVHSGLSASEHGVTRLSDGHRLETKAVWDILSEAGYRVWVCGSMNARYDRPLNGMLLPDPWSIGLSPYPEHDFDPYYNFVRYVVQEHTNPGARLSKFDAFKFLWFMLTHGLSPSTIRAVVAQLWSERRHHDSWKRAVILDLFQWDIFRHYYRKDRVDFSTFFLNSTAHFQHAYWRHMEPERFSVKPSKQEVDQYGNAILYGYQKMDELIGRFLKLAGQDATLIFCTGLSQQPYLKAESTGGRHYYRIIGPNVFHERLGIESEFEYNPVMSDQAILRFKGEDEARPGSRSPTLLIDCSNAPLSTPQSRGLT